MSSKKLICYGYVTNTNDIPNQLALTIYTHPKICQLNCYKCHNKLNSDKVKPVFLDDLIEKAKFLNIEWIVISGGEPLIFPSIKDLIFKLKRENFKIRVDTNGLKWKLLKELPINGVALDIKLPISKILEEDLSDKDRERYQKVLGITNIELYAQKVYQAVLFIKDKVSKGIYDSGVTLFRTVKYPLLSEEDFKEIKNFVEKVAPEIKYQLNPFIDTATNKF